MAERSPKEAHEIFTRAFNAGDLEALLALYEADALLMTDPPAKGMAAIREALKSFLALKGQIELETVHVLQNGDVALLRGNWRLKGTGDDGKPIEMQHSSAEVVRRQPDGSWRYIIDHPFGSD